MGGATLVVGGALSPLKHKDGTSFKSSWKPRVFSGMEHLSCAYHLVPGIYLHIPSICHFSYLDELPRFLPQGCGGFYRLNCCALLCTALCCSAVHRSALCCSAVHRSALCCSAVHRSALCCSAVHCAAEQCTLQHWN